MAPGSRTVARDAEAVEMLRKGATNTQVGQHFGLTPEYCQELCRRLRKSFGLRPLKPRSLKPLPRKPPQTGVGIHARTAESEHHPAIVELKRHLGAAWLTQELGTDTWCDDGQMLEALQLHAALRVVLLDAEDHLDVVRRRLRERSRGHLDHQSEAARRTA